MEQGFIDILKQIVTEQVNAVLSDTKQFKSVLADYTRNEFKKESRFLIQAVEAGVAKAIKETDDLPACKRGKINELVEDYGLSQEVSAAIVDTLALVLRGDTGNSITATPTDKKAADSQSAPKQEGGLNKIEVNVAYRDRQGGGMKVERTIPLFYESAAFVLKEVISDKVKRCDIYLQSAAKPITDVATWIGFTGDIEGRLLLTMSKETALYAAGAMNLDTFTVFDDYAKSFIKELTNMITGTAQRKLKESAGINIIIDYHKTDLFDSYTEKDSNLVDEDAMVMPFELTEK